MQCIQLFSRSPETLVNAGFPILFLSFFSLTPIIRSIIIELKIMYNLQKTVIFIIFFINIILITVSAVYSLVHYGKIHKYICFVSFQQQNG